MDIIAATRHGKVRGRVDGSIASYLGIPYAAAPFGVHRFRAPAPVEPWEGIRDALEFGPTAPQRPYRPPLDRLIPDVDIPGEECLNLNVWAPRTVGEPLPVLVWIHGGSLRNGSAAMPLYDGRAFARDGVVLVSINYRLGVEGFGVFPDAPDNRGLLDQIAALTWVRDNIAGFGGDPGCVTVCGESAGAISIAALLTSPRAAGLFHRAILQSGPPHTVTRDKGAGTVRAMAKALRVPATAEGFAGVDRERLLDAQDELVGRADPVSGGPGFHIVVDDDVVPADPPPPSVDLLLGCNREEYRLWFVPSGAVERVGRLTLRLALLKFGIPGRVARLYRAGRPDAKPGVILGEMATDLLLRGPLNRLADSRLGESRSADSRSADSRLGDSLPADSLPCDSLSGGDSRPGRTFFYEFAWRSPVLGLGACHALEIGFVFDNLRHGEALSGPDAPQPLADAMHRAWVDFTTSGDPGWAAWDTRRPVRVFDHPGTSTVLAPRQEELRAWL
ncbi:carboxylesterase/lipase family protein [Streptomyces anulatus]|uniref:Carboxylic ester hydrolase n=1 Tax=Streptomyces anulatus TaxID=1892 RepID=A0A7K3RF46_STRAQ|nr:carboxylesterase family protein [Streptomyces anulatus]NEC00834.1 carboxylesterase/lipase family protein [Streptomyces anulatus]NED26512.1 carboxylesterase/lipase family protein [Streptomyces anulatus]